MSGANAVAGADIETAPEGNTHGQYTTSAYRRNKAGPTKIALLAGAYKVVLAHAAQSGIAIDGVDVHSLRATAATNALEHEADIANGMLAIGAGTRVASLLLGGVDPE
jgi:hypothetical protein